MKNKNPNKIIQLSTKTLSERHQTDLYRTKSKMIPSVSKTQPQPPFTEMVRWEDNTKSSPNARRAGGLGWAICADQFWDAIPQHLQGPVLNTWQCEQEAQEWEDLLLLGGSLRPSMIKLLTIAQFRNGIYSKRSTVEKERETMFNRIKEHLIRLNQLAITDNCPSMDQLEWQTLSQGQFPPTWDPRSTVHERNSFWEKLSETFAGRMCFFLRAHHEYERIENPEPPMKIPAPYATYGD